MSEATFTTKLLRWMKYHFKGTFVYEVKITKGNSLPFSALKEHQRLALFKANVETLRWKIPDAGYQNPFDGVSFQHVPAYVIVQFNHPCREFVVVDIKKWIHEKNISERKSLTFERAQEIGTKYRLGKN